MYGPLHLPGAAVRLEHGGLSVPQASKLYKLCDSHQPKVEMSVRWACQTMYVVQQERANEFEIRPIVKLGDSSPSSYFGLTKQVFI